jgi:hypothetical protein
MRSSFNGAKLNGPLRKGVWAECANTATVNDNLSVSKIDEKQPYERFYQRPSKLVWNIRTFGEMAVATKKNKIQGKRDNKGAPVMFVGYAPDHEGILKVIFVRSEDNDADIFTKNLPKNLHQEHARKMIEPKGEQEEWTLIGLNKKTARSYNGRKGIGQYRRGLSVDPVMSQVVGPGSDTRLNYDSMRFGETQGDSETLKEVRRTSGEYG